MLSRRWPRPKWIKHVAAQVGSAHPSGVTLNLQLKRSFPFNQSGTFSFKVLEPIRLKRGHKTTNKSSKKVSRLRNFERGSSHVAFLTRTKNSDARPIKLSFQHYTETAYSLPTHITHRTTIPNHPLKNDLHGLSSSLVEKGPYLSWHTNFYLFKDKRN